MNLSYRWVIVAAGALMSCVAIGTMFSLAIFLEPMALDTQWSRAGISSAMTLNFLVMGLGGFRLGCAFRPFWRPHRRGDRCGAARAGAGGGEPRRAHS